MSRDNRLAVGLTIFALAFALAIVSGALLMAPTEAKTKKVFVQKPDGYVALPAFDSVQGAPTDPIIVHCTARGSKDLAVKNPRLRVGQVVIQRCEAVRQGTQVG